MDMDLEVFKQAGRAWEKVGETVQSVSHLDFIHHVFF